MSLKPFISVIVPVYKVEAYIGKCLHSLCEQSFDDYEIIIVDDATPDRSMDIVAAYADKYAESRQIRILHHKENRGLPAARNTGLMAAKGEYIFHCDSDDWIETDTFQLLHEYAKETRADVVWFDWFLSFVKNERYMKEPCFQTAMEALKGVLSGTMKYNVWNKIVRRSLYFDNQIVFPAGHGMGEDMTMIRLLACARIVVYVPEAFYHYVKLNSEAFTNTMSERHLEDLKYNVDETIAFLRSRLGGSAECDIAYFKLNVKFPFLISDRNESYKQWEVLYSEANQYVNKNKALSFRSRMLQYAAWKKQYWIVWLYYKLIYKLVYGIIYK